MRHSRDMTYVDQSMVERGLARVVPRSIRIDRYFSEEEQAANVAAARALRDAGKMNEWGERCDEMAKRIGEEVVALLSEIEKRYTIAQYRQPYHYHDKKTEDFWFWCNIHDGEPDFSYVTLNFWKERTADEKQAIIDEIERFLDGYPARNIQAYIQYETVCDDEACKREAERIYNESKGKFVTYGMTQGRLFKDDQSGAYYFRRKHARKYYSHMSAVEVCGCVPA